MRVVCTAGHVDHGKSTLVRALTGMEPDRFAEEQQRGLTIDLGFAWGDFNGQTITFVDLPGHERFVGNMLAGAGAVDLALFVVAADEGWMPQSQEHLDILDLLGVSRGLVAITKADTVDAETLALSTQLVVERLVGTAFADVEAIAVSAKTGLGLDNLTAALGRMLTAAPLPADTGRPRLWVDRAFSIRGAGTVVTGTLGGGELRVGDEVALLPGDRFGRVRGLQALKEAVDAAPVGSRVAVNVSGLDRDEVARGDALVRAGQWRQTQAFDAWVRALPDHAVGRKGAWQLHAGSARRVVEVYPLALGLIGGHDPGGGMIRVELDQPLAVAAGDRFVLREAGRGATVGGGLVLDADPPARPSGTLARIEREEALESVLAAVRANDRPRLLLLAAARGGAVQAERVAASIGLSLDQAQTAANAHGLIPMGASWAHPDAVAVWTQAVHATLMDYHAANPLDRAAPKDVAVRAAQKAGCPAGLVPILLDLLVAARQLVAVGPGLRVAEHKVVLDDRHEAARDALLAALSAEPFSPPGLAEAAKAAKAPPALVRELEAAGTIIRLGPDLVVIAEALPAALERLRTVFLADGPLTAAQAKDALGTSRKYALPLLEELDRRGHTRRIGDVREVRS